MPNSEALLIAAAAGGLAVVVLLVALLVRIVRRRRRRAAPAEPVGGDGGALFRAGLTKTRQSLGVQLAEMLRRDQTPSKWMEELEEALILADAGVPTTQRLLDAIRRRREIETPEALLAALKDEIRALLRTDAMPTVEVRPRIVLIAGVNGVGKTTTIGKLAHLFQARGESVLLVAADTFRAAAIEQLEIWAKRVGCDLIRHQSGADPSAVAFDGVKAARSRGVDAAIIDTAGRLHVKVNLMEELKKIVRVIGREMPGAPHEILLVLDSTTGQNALSQARLFQQALPLTGLILTKLDGTAKGGAVLAVKGELGLPIRYVGLGEGLNDLAPFDPDAFADALFESGSSARNEG